MTHGGPTGEVRPMLDRGPPAATETRGASVGTRFGLASGAGPRPWSLAYRPGTAHRQPLEAGNWGISGYA
jgi:hypothetical protein